MSKVEEIRVLAAAASALMASPRDRAAWWQVAEGFSALGDQKACASTYADLGRSASELGAVGLAVACVLKLRAAGDARAGDALLDRITRTHCDGSKRIDSKQISVPPVPPTASSALEPEEVGPGEKAARDAAKSAVRDALKVARERAPKILAPTPLVRFLSPKDLQALVDLMTLRSVARGDVVVDVGDSADALYWIALGSAEVSKGDKLLGELHSDAFFGEIALVGATTRTARVACLEDTQLLIIPAAAIVDLAAKAPNLAKVLAQHARTRLLSNVMRTSELFRRLSTEEQRSLLPRFESRFADEGEALIVNGQENHSLFVLVSGTCEVRDGEELITTLSVGDGFGEMSMLGRKPASCDVVASSPALLLEVSRDKFDEIAVAHPGLLAEVYRLLVTRDRENSVAIIHDADDLVI